MGNIIEGAKGFLRVAGAWTSEHSPEILLTTAGVGFLATIYVTVKATRENDILDEVHEDYLADVEKNSDASEEEKDELLKQVASLYVISCCRHRLPPSKTEQSYAALPQDHLPSSLQEPCCPDRA